MSLASPFVADFITMYQKKKAGSQLGGSTDWQQQQHLRLAKHHCKMTGGIGNPLCTVTNDGVGAAKSQLINSYLNGRQQQLLGVNVDLYNNSFKAMMHSGTKSCLSDRITACKEGLYDVKKNWITISLIASLQYHHRAGCSWTTLAVKIELQYIRKAREIQIIPIFGSCSSRGEYFSKKVPKL